MASAAEAWKSIPGTGGKYAVSNFGRVLSVRYRCFLRGGRSNKSGHLSVYIGRLMGSNRVHVLVASAFVGPCPPGMEVRHLDGNEGNNRSDNLVYSLRGRNIQDMKWHKGKTTTKLRPDDVRRIKARLGLESNSRLGAAFGVHKSTIQKISAGVIHTDV